MTPLRVKAMRKAWAAGDAKRDAGNIEPEKLKKFKDINYKNDGKKHHLMDIYTPLDATGPMPTIVSIHGGGYFYGDKELYRFYCMDLAMRGFTVVNFNYRLAPENRFPAPLEDINSVMEWIDANAADYFIDKEKLFLVGDSAGAQLASHYATIYASKEYQKYFDFTVPNVRILGISLACGLYSIIDRKEVQTDSKILDDYLGKKFDMEDKRIHNKEFIDGNYPATNVFSSSYDFLKDQCEPFYDFLNAKGIHTQMKIYGTEEDKELGHVFHVNMKLPEAKACNDAQCAFFRSLI